MGAGVAGTDDHPITFAPPISPVARFGPGPVPASGGAAPAFSGVPGKVAVGSEPKDDAVRLAIKELATEAGIVDVTVNVLPVSVGDADAVVVLGSLGSLGSLGLLSVGGGAGAVELPPPPPPPPLPPLLTNAGFPPIGELEMSWASLSGLVSINTPSGPARMSAWNWTVMSFNSGCSVIVT